MSAPTRPIPDGQLMAFNRAICERLGLDPAIIEASRFRADWTVVGGEDLAKVSVSFDAYLPADEILAMFNAAARPNADA